MIIDGRLEDSLPYIGCDLTVMPNRSVPLSRIL